ncbi:hypothetical protein [Flavobacterium channae]|uniref:hypothetical protein n=1 Tax=Flavobacterium channae TaxID=2897181 RepID=UPI001E5F3B97|nr:hypothetical protein [Flavobacterium channae]UGS23759.1 hypothetical protein LOS89_00450 [Flavobacterium channae]
MNTKKFFIAFSLFSLISCGTAVKKLAGFKNPKVEDKKELANYFSEVLPNASTYFMKVNEIGNEKEIFNNIVSGLNTEILLFSNSGEKYCYLGTEECSGIQMQNAFKNFTGNYSPCKENNSFKLNDLLNKITDIKGNTITIDDLPKADYYIFQNWNKYSGSKKKLKEDIDWLLGLKKNSNLNIEVIFVNSDMLEDWGLEEKGELPIKFKKEGKGFTMTFGELPLKTKQQHND